MPHPVIRARTVAKNRKDLMGVFLKNVRNVFTVSLLKKPMTRNLGCNFYILAQPAGKIKCSFAVEGIDRFFHHPREFLLGMETLVNGNMNEPP